MKRLHCSLLSALLLPAVLVNAEPPKPSPVGKAIVLVSVGHSDPAVMKRFVEFLSQELDCKVRTAPDEFLVESTPEKQAEALGKKILTGDDVCMVALMNVPQETQFVGAVLPSRRVALLNIRYPDLPAGKTPDKELFSRRIEEDTIRMVAKLMEMPQCPFPLCALRHEQSTSKTREVHARNLCPPCTKECRERLHKKGAVSQGKE